jgi:hypothetical protein
MTQPLPPDHPLCAAHGLWHPTAPQRGAVVLFRQVITLKRPLRGARLAISACHRYELRCDGALLARGPSRSDPRRWYAREVELPALPAGRHVLAVAVAHDGDGAGESQLGGDGFLAIAGLGALSNLLPADGWRCCHDRAVRPGPEDGWGKHRRYSPVGVHERFVAADHPWGWASSARPTGDWQPVRQLRRAADEWGNLALGVQLWPEAIPAMAETPLPLRCVMGDGAALATGSGSFAVAARSVARLVLDRGASGVHWPEVRWSNGQGASIRLTWCEAPRTTEGRLAPRTALAGNDLPGHVDVIEADGGRGRRWQPRWLRSGRYLVIDITTADAPLRLDDVRLADSGFPFTTRMRLRADPAWDRLLAITDRTLRSCAHEAIWDCPHYEQCQFPGDTRVQVQAQYLLYGDDRLARKALTDLADSQRPDGLRTCRAPARSPQRIDTFTLQWVLALDEFWTWRGDAAFVTGLLPAARRALDPFLSRLRRDGMVGGGLMAPFVDWSRAFTAGNAPQDADGGSAIVALQLAQACSALERLETAAGWPELAARWRRQAAALRRAVAHTCLRDGVLWDTPARQSRSVHAQVEAVHAGLLRGAAARRALAAATADPQAAQIGTRYYTWHLATAWMAAGAPRRALDLISGWSAQAAADPGLATWPESDGNPRSDCHGWGAYPVLAAARLLLGIAPVEPGMAAVAFAPLASAGVVSGSVPTPHGPIRVALRDNIAELRSPVPVLHRGRRLRPGVHHLRLDPA